MLRLERGSEAGKFRNAARHGRARLGRIGRTAHVPAYCGPRVRPEVTCCTKTVARITQKLRQEMRSRHMQEWNVPWAVWVHGYHLLRHVSSPVSHASLVGSHPKRDPLQPAVAPLIYIYATRIAAHKWQQGASRRTRVCIGGTGAGRDTTCRAECHPAGDTAVMCRGA